MLCDILNKTNNKCDDDSAGQKWMYTFLSCKIDNHSKRNLNKLILHFVIFVVMFNA